MTITIFNKLIGKTFTRVVATNDNELIFDNNYEEYKFFHEQECCEDVHIDDIIGDLKDLENTPITMAEEINSDDTRLKDEDELYFKWTFYKFGTKKGSVTVKWYGTSNGYYSVSVDFEELLKKLRIE